MKLDKSGCEQLRKEINVALQTVADRHGLEISLGNGKFLAGKNATYKLHIAAIHEATGMSMTPEAHNFAVYATHYGLKAEMLGSVLREGDKSYKIIGLNTRRAFGKPPKYPVLLKNTETGAGLKATPQWVLSKLNQ